MSPDSPAVAREVGVVQHVVVEAVGRQEVAAVVGLVERPVVAQALGAQHEHAIVAQLVVLDDRQRLERLPEADAVGDDAAAEAVQLVDRTDDAVALELVELLPDHRVADAGGRLDDALFVQLLAAVMKKVEEDQIIDKRWCLSLHQILESRQERVFCIRCRWQAVPQPANHEPRSPIPRKFRTLNQAELVARCDAEASVVNGQLPVMTRRILESYDL